MPGGERNGELAGGLERGEAPLGRLVGRAAVAVEIGPQRLDHHPLRGAHRSQRRELVGEQRAGVGVGEQAGLVAHEAAHRHEVVDGRRVAVGGQPLLRHRIAILGALAQGEEGFVATRARTAPSDGQHLVGGEVRRLEASGRLGERAVAALVATQHRERDEHLRRERHAGAVRLISNRPGLRHQLVQRQGEHVVVSH